MMNKNNSQQPENKFDEQNIRSLEDADTIKAVLFWICLIVSIGLAVLVLVYLLNAFTKEAVVTAASLILILTAMELNRRGRVQFAVGIVAVILVLTVTALTTIGQGIHDIGIIAYPAILLIAGLIMRRRSVLLLTILTIVCTGWLVFGDMYGLYKPAPPTHGITTDFLLVTGTLVVTAVFVQMLANTLNKNLVLRSKDMQKRLGTERALREAETMYRALVEQTTVVTYRDTADLEGSPLYISPQIEKLIGYTAEEWTSKPGFWQALVHPDDLLKVVGVVEQYITTGKRTISEYRLRAKDGRWVWVRDEAVVIKDDAGNPQFVHGVYIDITEQKEAELKLKQREAILGAVAETAQLLLKSGNWRDEINLILKLLGEATGASHVYIFENHPGLEGVMLSSQRYEWAAPGVIPELNNPVYQNTRLIPTTPGLEDWYSNLGNGRSFYGSRKQYPRYWKKVFAERGLKTLLDVPVLVNGSWWGIIGFDDFVNEMPWSQAEIDALVAAAGNLGTAISRQQSDASLHASEEKFQLAFHRTFVPMLISRASDQMILDANQAFCNGAGYTREEVVGQSVLSLNLWVNKEDQLRHTQVLAEQGHAEEFKAEFRRKSGETGVALISAITVHLGDELCLLHTLYDISKIEELLNQLKSKNEELQNFTYTVSHDLKAPLVTISGFLGYLAQDAKKGDTERVARDILRINDAVTRMQRLLSELLELSRIGRLMNPPETVPFKEIVDDALGVIEGRLEEKQVQVKVEADLSSVYGDRARLVQVVQNLVDNAAKFMGEQENPLIEIGVDRSNNEHVFFVRDNGIGIETEQHDRIFGLFNKLDANTEGTGIGLALVKRIVEVHGGRIWVESEGLGKGTTFHFTLADRQGTRI
jgi:PAS domain S-box-containing protein